jgi:hypothetical protein
MRIVRLGMVVALLVTGVGLTVSTAAADQYSARRATSVKVLWRRPLKQQHPLPLTPGRPVFAALTGSVCPPAALAGQGLARGRPPEGL